MKFKIIILLLLGVMGSCQSQNLNGSKEQQTDSIPLDPAVRYGKLDNGFTYYIRKNDTPVNKVELRLVVKAGRMHEDEDQLEYAHLLEHLLAGKTKNFSNLKEHFRESGSYRNAQTKARLTSYEAIIPSQDQQVKDGIRVLRDWGQGLVWDPEYIDVQRGAIQGEMRAIDPYINWVGKITLREVLKNTDYKVYGEEKHVKNLQNFNPEAFMRFYKDWYRPDLQAAIVVGDINIDSIEHEIRRWFSDMEIPKNPRSAREKIVAHTIDLNGSNRFSTVSDSVRQELHLSIVRLRPNLARQPKNRKEYRKMLLEQLYMIMLDAKAAQLQQQFDPPFSEFSTRYGLNFLPDRQLNATRMNLELETEDLQLVKKDFQRGLMAWKKIHHSLNQADVEKAKTALLNNYNGDNLMTSNSLISKYEDHFVYGKAAPHPEEEAKMIAEILCEMELKDILDYVSEYGNLDENTNYIIFKGTNINLPDDGVFQQWIKETDTMNISPLVKKQEIESLEDVVDIPASDVMSEVEIIENEIGVSTVNLPNRVQLVLKPTTPTKSSLANVVSIQAFRPNEVPLDNRQEYLAAKVAPEVLEYTGAGPYNKFELDRFKRQKGIRLRFRTTKDNQMIFAASKMEILHELFRLLYLYLEEPRKDHKAFQAWKIDQEKRLEGKALRRSEEFVMDKITAAWYPQIPVLGMDDLKEINLQEVIRASEQWFSGIENFTFIVTGDFDKDTILPILVNTLSGFPTDEKSSSVRDADLNFPLKKMEKDLEYKNINGVYARLFFPVKVPGDLKTQLELRLLSKALNKRIQDSLRTGSYFPTARGEWLDIKNGIYAFRVDFDSALGDEERMLHLAIKEFRELKENGVEKEWLETTIANEVRSYESRFNNFGYIPFWPDYLQMKLEAGEDPVPGILNYGTLMEHFISLEDINAAGKKYMTEEHYQQFLGYPEGYQQVQQTP